MSTTNTLIACLIAAACADVANELGSVSYWVAVGVSAVALGIAGYELRRIINGKRRHDA